jgi:oxalate decarboxylase
MSGMQRRDFLTGTAAAATTAVLAQTGQTEAGPSETADKSPEPIRDNEGATIIGPRNPDRERQSVDRLRPPVTDQGTLPMLRWSFADSHIKMREGGWSRQTTRRGILVPTVVRGRWITTSREEIGKFGSV